MAEFTSELVVTREVGAKKFILISPLSYQSDLLETKITVPTGYATDFASIPRIARSLIPQVGKHVHAAVIHDWLCEHGWKTMGVDQKLADEVFYEAMQVCGVRWTKRRVMFKAVRAFQRLKFLLTPGKYDEKD